MTLVLQWSILLLVVVLAMRVAWLILRWSGMIQPPYAKWMSYGPDWQVYHRVSDWAHVGEIVGGARGFRARVAGVGEVGYPDTAAEARELVEAHVAANVCKS